MGGVASDTVWRRVPLTVGESAENELDFYWTEIASALTEDYNRFTRKLVLRRRKGCQSRLKTQDFNLSNDAAYAFFKRVSADKTPKAPAMTRGRLGLVQHQRHGAWVAMMRHVREDHEFDRRVTAYHFRHWTITDWLNAGIVTANVATQQLR